MPLGPGLLHLDGGGNGDGPAGPWLPAGRVRRGPLRLLLAQAEPAAHPRLLLLVLGVELLPDPVGQPARADRHPRVLGEWQEVVVQLAAPLIPVARLHRE